MAGDAAAGVLPNVGAVRTGVPAGTKRALFAQLGALAQDALGLGALGLDAGQVVDCLAARERLGSTGFGGGVAIPHARLPGLPGIAGVIVRLAQPVAYKAVDDHPVDLVVALLSPPDAGAEHLKVLAAVSRRLRDPHYVAKLRGAGSPEALYALWTEGA